METKAHSEPLCSDRYCAGYDCMCSCHAPQELMGVLRKWLDDQKEKVITERKEGKHA